MSPAAQIPYMQLVAVLAGQQELGVDAVLVHVGRTPLAGDHSVAAQVPPEVVSHVLRTTIQFPAAPDFERLWVHDEDAARAFAFGRAERVEVYAIGPAVNRVRPAVTRAAHDRLSFDHLHDLRPARIRFCVDNVDARRSDPRYNQVSSFHVRMGRVRAQARAAGVPTEMM